MGRLDATQAEQPYVVDPAPLSNLGEALALLQGRTTYDHRRRGQQIEERDDFTVKGSPAETPGWYRAGSDVVAEHRCGTTPLPTIPSRLI